MRGNNPGGILEAKGTGIVIALGLWIGKLVMGKGGKARVGRTCTMWKHPSGSVEPTSGGGGAQAHKQRQVVEKGEQGWGKTDGNDQGPKEAIAEKGWKRSGAVGKVAFPENGGDGTQLTGFQGKGGIEGWARRRSGKKNGRVA